MTEKKPSLWPSMHFCWRAIRWSLSTQRDSLGERGCSPQHVSSFSDCGATTSREVVSLRESQSIVAFGCPHRQHVAFGVLAKLLLYRCCHMFK